MKRVRLILAVITAVSALALFCSAASAQSATGVTVFFGRVTIDGKAAPLGTVVNVILADGTKVGTGKTGDIISG